MFRIESTPNPLDALVAGTGTSFVQNKLAQQAEQQRMQKLDKATAGLDENSSDIAWLKALNNIPKEDQQAFLKIHENIAKGRKATAEQKESLNKEDRLRKEKSDIEEKKQSESRAIAKYRRGEQLTDVEEASLSPETQRSLLVQENKPEKKEKVDKAVQDAYTDELKAKDSLTNLTRLDELSEKLKGPIGSVKALFGTETPAEYDALGLAAIEPVIKMFNPVGAIPTQKIELIQKKFAPKAGDLYSTQKGKITALRNLANQGLARAKQRLQLLQGNANPQDLSRFDAETQELGSTIMNYELGKIESDKSEEDIWSHPESYKGRTATADDGKKYKSDGKSWSPVNG